MTMKPGLLKQPGGMAEAEKRAAAAADYSMVATKELGGGEAGGETLRCDGDPAPPKGGRGRMNGGEAKAAKGSRGAGAGAAWGRGGAALVPAGDSVGRGGGGGGGGPGDGAAPLSGLEVLHWGKLKKQQQVQQPPSSQPQGPGPTQSARLKQIVLLQLDLIEQQQQQLQLKEREIDELKAEKETLLARLERMERRMQLVKKENEKDKHRFVQTVDGTEEKNATEVEKIQPEHQQITPEQSLVQAQGIRTETHSGKGYKRKSALGITERKAPVKKLAAEFSRVRTKLVKSSPQRQTSSSPLPDKVSKRELRSKETPEKSKSQTEGVYKPSTILKTPGLPTSKDQPVSNDIEEEPYLCTTEMYLCRWHHRPPSPLREPSPKKEETVAIPSWKEHSAEPLINLQPDEIIENLDDCVFAKRHAKLELDEKRRKRWDIQRIREQRLLQRLQLRMYKKKGIQESEPEILSFFPEPDDVESLVITPFLPVVAFGRPLPKLSQQNFELPWLDERSRCRIDIQKKQTPHRTCRK
ncbi:male-specific lethal 1 homolog isoform X1 [Chiloscyllium plagiosum]|uniref:male-specific lethal 1 homolog isoform X1 n=1 Tax=Chiloscyllium plagiosum TaxID=36176 RepID=UPI001CB84BE5|nr:male-specific lethal 1 homolog isoform X1 [Chiloscyllium plagiosum]